MDLSIKQTFSKYNAEKMSKLLIKRYNPKFEPMGFVIYITLIINDIRCGLDGFTRQKIEKNMISVTNTEIVNFATLMKGEKFAEEVKQVL